MVTIVTSIEETGLSNGNVNPSGDSIDDVFFRVVRIETFAGSQLLSNASGFFYLALNYLYIITTRHVVTNRFAGIYPERLRVPVHKDKRDLTKTVTIEIPLFDGGTPRWLEHPIWGASADIVAIPIHDRSLLRDHFISTFGPEDILDSHVPMPMGQEVLIVSFPLGFHDTVHHLPIVRGAIVASAFSIPFKGQSYFLTDAPMHRGTSGAPVIARRPASSHSAESVREWRLLGVHASALDVSDRDPSLDEKLQLNCAWYASLIDEIVSAGQPYAPRSVAATGGN